MSFKIGNIEIKNQIVLAPMAGISNPAFMHIAEEMGAGLVFTELISAEAIFRNNQKTFSMLKGIETLKIPVGIQLFGSNPATLAKAAQKVTELYPNAFIDINMGCPVPKVAIKNQAGSALLKNPEKIKEIIATVVKSVSVPVTVKIRSGWDENNINAVEVAKVIEQAGASALTIHARTRSQGYSGKANWDIIKQVKQAVKIPVIGNGDVRSCYDAEKMLNQTGCDAIMIGRAILGNPWLIQDCVAYLEKHEEPKIITDLEKIEMIKHHYDLLNTFGGEKLANLEIRVHLLNYLKKMPNSKEMKNKVCLCKTGTELMKVLLDYEKYLKENFD